MKITYTNTDDDMLVKFTYQQANNKKVAIKLENQKNIYIFGAIFLFIISIYFFFQLNNGTASVSKESAITTLVLGFVMLACAFLLKPYKQWEISQNVKKGIKAVEKHDFKPVTIEIKENRFNWDDGTYSGGTYVTPENKSIIAIEDKNYIFISGAKHLDLVIPKKVLNDEELNTLYKCLSYAQYKD